MKILKYRGYEGSAELDPVSSVCHGKILFIDDAVTFECPAEDLQREFQASVDDYIETCAALSRAPRVTLEEQTRAAAN